MRERREDEDLEAFLRRFEPRAPSPLPIVRRSSSRTWWALAAASLATAALWIGSREPALAPIEARPARMAEAAAVADRAPRSRTTLAQLSIVLRPVEAVRVADELQTRVLADPTRTGGALREMASAGPGH